MKVLVTGVDGYIGSLLGPLLMREGHSVIGLDTGYYREGWLYNDRTFFTRMSPGSSLCTLITFTLSTKLIFLVATTE